MNLLYVLHQFLPRYVTGTEQYVRSLALGLKRRGHDVRVFAFEPQVHLADPGRTWIELDEEVDGIPVRRVGIHEELLSNHELNDYRNPLATRLLRRFLEEWTPDLAHVFHLRNLGVGVIEEMRGLGLPVVVNLMDFWFLCPRFTLLRHNGDLCDGPPDSGLGCVDCADPGLSPSVTDSGVGRLLLPLVEGGRVPLEHSGSPLRRARAQIGRRERLLGVLDQADQILAPSRFLISMFERNGFPSGRLRHMPYGVDPDRLDGRRKSYEGEWSSPLSIGYVGSLTPHKGLHLVIEALQQIGGDAWRLHAHGNPKVHPSYASKLGELAAGDSRIEFHGEFRPRQLGEVLDGIDLLVVPSVWYENTPFTILEAQMMGLPILGSDLGGISEIVKEGQNGFLFEAGDVDSLTSVLRRILADPLCLSKLDLTSSARTLEQNLDDFERVYNDVVG